MNFDTLPSILNPDIGLLFWMFLAFIVVFIVLARLGFPAIIGMVDKRSRYINESLKKAEQAASGSTREAGLYTERGCCYS